MSGLKVGNQLAFERTARPFVTHADTAPAYWLIEVLWRVLATGIQTGGAVCLLDQLCSAGSGPPRHTHPQDEGLYVARGKVTFSAGGLSFSAGSGSLVSVPRHTEHSFVVDEEAVLINFYFPAGFELWLMGSALPAERNELPPADAGMPPYHLMRQLSDDYGGLPLTQERTTSPNPDARSIPALSSRETAENWWFNCGCWSILADAGSTGGGHSVFEVEMPRGLAEQPSVHDLTDVACYILDGAVDILIDNEVHALDLDPLSSSRAAPFARFVSPAQPRATSSFIQGPATSGCSARLELQQNDLTCLRRTSRRPAYIPGACRP